MKTRVAPGDGASKLIWVARGSTHVTGAVPLSAYDQLVAPATSVRVLYFEGALNAEALEQALERLVTEAPVLAGRCVGRRAAAA